MPAIFSLHSLAMGEETDGPAGAAGRHGGTGVMDGPALDEPHRSVPTESDGAASSEISAGRRRFTVAAVVGTVVAVVPFVWILWGPWESPDPIRKTAFEDNFYDLQARAIFHGHLWLANGAVGIEAFVHDGRQFTYFGLFPSIIRMPILALTSSLDGRLTVPYMLAAWLITALFVSLLLWRVRILMRGPVVMGRAEAAAFGVLIATIMVGSVFTVLASIPYVFAEDLAWSICLTVGSLFALLGVLERPSWGRVVAAGLLILCANLDRLTTGWACVVAAVLVAAWFGLGRGGQENRRWCVPVLVAGLVPLLIGCFVNYLKFGVPFGLPWSIRCGPVAMPTDGSSWPPTRFGGGHRLHTERCPGLPPAGRAPVHIGVPVRHPARGTGHGGVRRALRSAVPDGQPAVVDAAAVPSQLLGAGHLIPTPAHRQGRPRPDPHSGRRIRRCRPPPVGVHRAPVPGRFRALPGAGQRGGPG